MAQTAKPNPAPIGTGFGLAAFGESGGIFPAEAENPKAAE